MFPKYIYRSTKDANYDSNEYSLSEISDLIHKSIDFDFYIDRYRDIRINYKRSRQLESDLFNHYMNHRIFQGRQISESGARLGLQPLLETYNSKSILEIGPFTRPFLTGKNIKYFDIGNREFLIDAAKRIKNTQGISLPVENIPEIDFVNQYGDLSIINESFDVVFSSHAIEHQPNFIRHINNVSNILKNGGKYYIICPDKRYCFDYYNNSTRLIDIVAADIENRSLHPVRTLLEARTHITHNDARDHWMGKHGVLPSGEQKLKGIRAMTEEINQQPESYKDTHSWYFTPLSFSMIVKELNNLSLIDMAIEKIYPTIQNSNEFIVVLKKLNCNLHSLIPFNFLVLCITQVGRGSLQHLVDLVSTVLIYHLKQYRNY